MKVKANPEEELKWIRQSNFNRNTVSHVGPDVIAIGHGNAIQFVNHKDGTDNCYRVIAPYAGVACLCGHPDVSMFAFAEQSNDANIVLMTYPEFREICVLSVNVATDNSMDGKSTKSIRRICTMVFYESEHLIVLTGFPDYVLEVWNWRTQKRLGWQASGIMTDVQFLRANRVIPMSVIQLSYNLGMANFWELYTSIDSVSMIRRAISIPGSRLHIGSFSGTHLLDGSIMVTNSTLNLWQIQPQSNKSTLVYDNTNPEDGARCESSPNGENDSDSSILARLPEVEEDITHKRLFLLAYRGNIALIEPDGSLRVLKRNSSRLEWQKVYRLQSDVPFLVALVARGPEQQVLVGINTHGEVVVLEDNNVDARSWKILQTYNRSFKFIDTIEPLGEILITITKFSHVQAVRMDTGVVVDSIRTELGNITCLDSCSTLPVLAIGNDAGIVYLYSMYNAMELKQLAQFHLSDHAITIVQVNQSANCFVVMDETNALFVLQGHLGHTILVKNHVQLVQHPICIEIHMNPKHDELIVTALLAPTGAPARKYSNHIWQIHSGTSKPANPTREVELEISRNYSSIKWLWTEDNTKNDDIFVAVPYLSKCFEVVRLLNEDNRLQLEVLHTCQTAHRINSLELRVYCDFLLTWSIDGMVQVWNTLQWTMLSRHQATNFWSNGVRNAVTNYSQQLIVILGQSGNLQCLYNPTSVVDNRQIFKIRNWLKSKDIQNMFGKQTIGFEPRGAGAGKSWLQIQSDEHKEHERKLYAEERQSCRNNLEILRAKLKELIDGNTTAPEDEQLSIEEFDLDIEGTAFIKQDAEMERNFKQSRIDDERASLSQRINAIISKTWARMEVKGRNVRGIFTKLKVENYSLLFEDQSMNQQLRRAQMWRDMEEFIAEGDTFQPWEPKTLGALMVQLNQRPACKDLEKILSFTDKPSVESVNASSKNRYYSLTGTSSHNFIRPIPIRYEQFEIVSYIQMILENTFGYCDVLALRKYFNKKFDEMSSIKDSELCLAHQRNDRLRHIQSELNKLEELNQSGMYHERPIVDPDYLLDELPESIVKVEAHELSVTPYISPSEQALLDAAAAEAERRRLELLADDFRDRALMKMMNGVLEIRWEDEIKKTPPAPECVRSGKDPKDYTPDDLAAILLWEAEITHLESERERYRGMLFAEQDKIDQILEDQIKKFNLKVGGTLMEKIKVEFAIGTEDLKLLRNREYNLKRVQLANKERTLSSLAQSIRDEISSYTEILNQLEDKLLACKNRYEDLSQKDRLLDRHFKSSFGEFAGKAVVDQAYRMFRRRPKWQMRAWQTPAILTDMARRTIAADSTRIGPPLPDECFQFLQQVDQGDKLSNAPNLMDANTWQILCKMRRVKLEMEFRVKSLAVQVADAESTVNAFVREINAKKAKMAQYNQQEAETLKQRVENQTNRTVQICIKRGLVEIPLSGRISDFSNAILLHSSDVHDINRIIKKAGQKKLKTMQNAAIFRRKITMKEWEHEVLRMRIDEKQFHIKCIQKTKITKEIQLWMKYKKMDWKEDISDNALTREKEACRKSLEFMCNEIISSINETNTQIAVKQQHQRRLDAQIQSVNLDLTELNQSRDIEKEKRISKEREQRLNMMMLRSQLVREIQLNHAKILELCTVLELQRLRTFPTLAPPGLQGFEQSDGK